MKALVIGLGSMGKRRLRTWKALGVSDLTGFDLRQDRRQEAHSMYQVPVREAIDESTLSSYDFLVISTPPDQHLPYMKLAVKHRIPAFIEASVLVSGLPEVAAEAKKAGVLLSPSCTMRFYPAIKDIKELVTSQKFGRVTSFSYHSGQFLPDWHPWEKVSDFYVSKKETGGAREIVPYELTWMVDVLGFPTDVKGFFGKTMDVGADIDDSYSISLKYPASFGSLVVDVVGRHATRNLILNLERGQILWNWDWWEVRAYDAVQKRWTHYKQSESVASAHPAYNKNIVEEMYIEENRAFLDQLRGVGRFPHTLEDDIRVLQLLQRAEQQ